MIDPSQLSALILAGGQGLRMSGADKGLVDLNQRRMIDYVLDRIRPQVSQIMISANRSQADYQGYDYPVLNDQLADFQGPLAGIAEGLKHCSTPWLLVVPCDSPQLPLALAQRLADGIGAATGPLAVAHDGQYLQPAFCLLHQQLQPLLQQYIGSGGRKLGQWLRQQQPAIIDFSDQPESFININTAEQLHRFETQQRLDMPRCCP